MMMKKAELVFIPSPVISHLVSTVELAKRLVNQDDRLSITILIMKVPFASNTSAYIESLTDSITRIQFLELPPVDPPSLEHRAPEAYAGVFIESYKPHIKQTITKLMILSESNSVRLAGIVIDFFFTTIIDVANELGVPTYLYFTSSAAMLGLTLYIPALHRQITTEFRDSETELIIPSFNNPVPPLVLPAPLLNKRDDSSYTWFLQLVSRFRETKCIIVNTFEELEPYAINSFLDDRIRFPAVYPVGPLIDLQGQTQLQSDQSNRVNIMKWLDNQPPSSVIFVCFGSMGTFGEQQVKEIALGLERSGCRFLWSLRQPSDYTKPEDILPDGFLERTVKKGLACWWVPQVEVLAHEAIGGFLSHCGWNSILESLWFGVPIMTWPLFAEQQLNAFEMVRELGLAVEMRLDYRRENIDLVMAEEVERGVRKFMEGDKEVRMRVKEMKEKSRKAVMESGSSVVSLGRLIEDLMEGITAVDPIKQLA